MQDQPPRYVDVTGPLAEGMWSYRPMIPAAPIFSRRPFQTVVEDGSEADELTLSTLTGTYLETAKHYYPDRRAIDQVPPDQLFVTAVVAQVPKGPGEHITVEDLWAIDAGLRPGDAAIVATGWDRHWFDAETFVLQSPHFTRETMAWLVERGAAIVGGDFPCFDDPVPTRAEGVNHPLLEADRLILAPLFGLTAIPNGRHRLTVLPLKVVGACGAPCRAIITLSGEPQPKE